MSGSGRIDLLVSCSDSARTDSSPGRVVITSPVTPDVVAQVDVVRARAVRAPAPTVRRVDHDLQVTAAVAQLREAQLPVVPLEDDPPGDRDPPPGRRVRREVAGLGRDLRQRVGARIGDRVGIDALGAEPVELGPAYPHLLGQLLGRHRLGHGPGAAGISARTAAAWSAPAGLQRAPVPGLARGAARDAAVRKPSALPAAVPTRGRSEVYSKHMNRGCQSGRYLAFER